MNLKASQAWSGKGTQNKIRLRRQKRMKGKRNKAKRKELEQKRKKGVLAKKMKNMEVTTAIWYQLPFSLSVFFGIIFK